MRECTCLMKADCIKWIKQKKDASTSCSFIKSRADTDAVAYINATGNQ